MQVFIEMGYSPCWMLALLLSYAVASSSREIKVLPTDCSNVRFQNCTGLTEALQEIQSDTTLILIPGDEHVLEQYVLVHDLWNITLVSGSKQSHVTITCSEGVGLAFINITNLTLQQLTIQGCGLSGGSLQNATVAVNDIVDMFFQVPTSLHIAVLLGSISNAHLIDVTVRDMVGLGLLGINLVGSSSMEGVTFANNTFENCTMGLSYDVLQDYHHQIGGGAFLAYFDYRDSFVWESRAADLTVHESNFLDNHDCSTTGAFERRMQFSNALCNKNYTVGAGGGLSVMITQKTFPVDVSITSCLFQRNVGQYGSGAHISHFINATRSKIVFHKCNFTENGERHLSDGAGIAVFANVLRPTDCFSERSFTGHFPNHIDVQVNESMFKDNIAYAGGGIFSWFVHNSFGNNVNFKLACAYCTFENNTAVVGSAIFAYELNIVTASSQTIPPGGLIEVSDICVQNNTLVEITAGVNHIRRGVYSSGIIDIRNVHLEMNGNSILANNRGTALRAKTSSLSISGTAVFDHNVGNFGGAISLIGYSFLVIQPDTSVNFSNNQASYTGGVFHVELEREFGLDRMAMDCFLYLNTSDQFCFDLDGCVNIHNLGITISFSQNKAAYYGNIVYGSALQTCAWREGLRNASNYNENVFKLISENEPTQDVFIFDPQMDERSIVTPSANLNINQTEYTAMPGQRFSIQLFATDKLGQRVAVPVTSAVLPSRLRDVHNYTALSTIGDFNIWSLHAITSTQLPMTVQGNENQQVRVAIFTTDSAVSQDVTINLTECVPCFNYSVENSSCECMPVLAEHGIDCSPEANLTIPDNVWVGLLALDTEPGNNESGAIAVSFCIFDYCKPGEKVIAAGDFDAQCAEGYNRGGLLCGSCSEGYSVVLGTRRCLKCTDNAYLALILAFAAAGILLVAVIAFLKVNLSSGYINGLLFYSHNLGPFIFRLAPTAPAIFLPVAFFNLDLGIETCFYDGMDALEYIGLQFVFPLYLFILMGIMILSARCIRCPCHKSFSAGKIFATLLVVTYTSILRMCCEVLQFVAIEPVTRPGTGKSIRWATDPSVHFFSGWHAALGVLSILLLIIYIIPLPLILLFPSKAYSFKYTGKMKPILDACFAPYKTKFRRWISIRLLIGIVLSTAPLYLPLMHTVFLIAVAIIILVFIQALLKPYRGFCRNATDGFLLVNMTILFIILLFQNDLCSYCNTEMLQQRHTIFSAAVVSMAYAVFLGILLYHIFLRLPLSVQDKIIHHNRFSKAIVKLYQELTASESEVTHDYELDVYIQFSDREKDDDAEESTFVKGASIVGAPQDSEGSAEISLVYS